MDMNRVWNRGLGLSLFVTILGGVVAVGVAQGHEWTGGDSTREDAATAESFDRGDVALEAFAAPSNDCIGQCVRGCGAECSSDGRPAPGCIQRCREACRAECMEKEMLCKAYANEAVSQNRQNLARHCRFTGPRWHSNFNVHYNWCMSVDPEAAQAETDARRRALLLPCFDVSP